MEEEEVVEEKSGLQQCFCNLELLTEQSERIDVGPFTAGFATEPFGGNGGKPMSKYLDLVQYKIIINKINKYTYKFIIKM